MSAHIDRDLFRRIQDTIAIVGIGHLPFAKDIRRPISDTAIEAIQLALADAGLDAEAVDGMCMFAQEKARRGQVWKVDFRGSGREGDGANRGLAGQSFEDGCSPGASPQGGIASRKASYAPEECRGGPLACPPGLAPGTESASMEGTWKS